MDACEDLGAEIRFLWWGGEAPWSPKREGKNANITPGAPGKLYAHICPLHILSSSTLNTGQCRSFGTSAANEHVRRAPSLVGVMESRCDEKRGRKMGAGSQFIHATHVEHIWLLPCLMCNELFRNILLPLHHDLHYTPCRFHCFGGKML